MTQHKFVAPVLLAILVLGLVLPLQLTMATGITEQLVNGDFEIGTTSPWNGCYINSAEHHVGLYSGKLPATGTMNQNGLSAPVAQLESFTLWAKKTIFNAYDLHLEWYAFWVGGGADYGTATLATNNTWISVDLTAALAAGSAGKTIWMVEFYAYGTNVGGNSLYLDDISFTIDVPPPPDLSLSLTCNPSSLAATIYVDGSPYTPPDVVLLSAGTYNITVFSTVGLYEFSRWQVNGTNGSTANSINLNIQGNTPVCCVSLRPVILSMTCNPSGLGPTIDVQGSPYTLPASISLIRGTYALTAPGSEGGYTFSKWQVNGSDSSFNPLSLNIQGNTSVRSFYLNFAGGVFPDPGVIPDPTNPTPSSRFHLEDVDLGTLSPGESRTFNMTFTFTDWMLILQSLRFTDPSTGFTVSWFVVNEALPKTYFNTFFNSYINQVVGTNQIVVTVTAPADAVAGTTGSFYATGSTDAGLSSTATISYKIQSTSIWDKFKDFPDSVSRQFREWLNGAGQAVGQAVEEIKRLLGNPWILLILIVLVLAIAYYSLRGNKKHRKSSRRR